MIKTATITSKRQITIPAALFSKVGLAERQKVLISEEEGKLVITPIVNLIEKLAGSLQVPSRWEGKDVDTIIEESKAEYFIKEKRK